MRRGARNRGNLRIPCNGADGMCAIEDCGQRR
jgi:hypothetical protein